MSVVLLIRGGAVGRGGPQKACPSSLLVFAGVPSFYPAAEVRGLPDKAFQPHADPDALRRMEAEGWRQFRARMGVAVGRLGLRTDLAPEQLDDGHVASGQGFLFIGPPKGEARARQKVRAKLAGDWSALNDLVRGTISVASFRDIRRAVRAVRAVGLELAQKPDDRFRRPEPTGYRDLMIHVRLANGMLAEIQFHLKALTAVKPRAHRHYVAERDLQARYGDRAAKHWGAADRTRFHAARRAQRALHDRAWDKATRLDAIHGAGSVIPG